MNDDMETLKLDHVLNEKIYTLADLEGILNVGRRQLYRYINDEPIQLKAFKIGGRWVVTESTLKAFIHQRKNG